jgi:Ni/Co efflux regulator RcnB
MKKFLALLIMFSFVGAPLVGCNKEEKKDEKKAAEKDGEKKDAEKKDAEKKDA